MITLSTCGGFNNSKYTYIMWYGLLEPVNMFIVDVHDNGMIN